MALTSSLPTLYEHYTAGGITNGLSVGQQYFTLNGRNISIYSGAMHYFRVPRPYWRDRLRKLRAAGLNTVETYVPWNLHEPQNGQFDFGEGGSDYEELLHLKEFLEITKEEDLLAIIRPGPYICAEWEWGGLPSWLLREDSIEVRTSETTYLDYAKRYFNILLPILLLLQFTLGGPIIAFQVENEYASSPKIDLQYIQELYSHMRANGIVELLVTSDSAYSGSSGTIPGTLFQTINFGSDPENALDILHSIQPRKPLMVMEFWTGWYDYWGGEHYNRSNADFHDVYEKILSYPSSVNLYMFHGGTNFGFLNGANIGSTGNADYKPVTTSYDYDAPLTEYGDYTDKYYIIKELIQKYNPVKLQTPDLPELAKKVAYENTRVESILSFDQILNSIENVVESEVLLDMELLPLYKKTGQSYGYLLYRKENISLTENSELIIKGELYDSVIVLVNGKIVSPILTDSSDLNGFGYWKLNESALILTEVNLTEATLDLLVENWGRANFGNLYYQYKGLGRNTVNVNEIEITEWKHYPLEFRRSWIESLTDWQEYENQTSNPAIYKFSLTIDEPNDTFLDMQDWTKGIVIVNGFNLGRYILIGPQQTLYLPGAFLKKGPNEILVFEEFKGSEYLKFSEKPIYFAN